MVNHSLASILKKRLTIKAQPFKEFFAELLGTFMLVLLGDGSVAQSVFTGSDKGDFFSVNWGFAIGVMMGVFIAGGVSGGHINPAVTVAMAVWGKLSWAKVPVYMVAQYTGAFLASAVVLGVYKDALNAYEPTRTLATAGIWATYPGVMKNATGSTIADYLSFGNGFGDEVLGTMVLLICVCAITDSKNMQVPKALIPVLVGFAVLGIGIGFGCNTGYAINPARDLSPRLLTLMAGWGESPFLASTSEGITYWWVPIVASHIGAVIGVLVYLLAVEFHHPETGEFELPVSEENIAVVISDSTRKYGKEEK